MMNKDTIQKDLQFFQISGLNDEEIKQHFVVRKNEYNRIIDEIKKDDMKGSVQHFILIGRRGSGKSTLLRRIQAEINTVASLNKRLVVINPSEEQAGIYRLYDLWERVIQELKLRDYEVKDILWSDYQEDEKNYSKALYQSIQDVLNKKNKKLIILLDNIDRIFDTIGDDSRLLRELLTNYNDMRIIGGSTRMSEHYWKYEKPFYQFFSLVRLDSLTAMEVKTLLLYWSKYLKKPEVKFFVENHPEKLDVVRTLTDGMPRTLLYFIKLLIGRPEQNGFDYLRFIIDKATPIYQERLSKLPPAQQKIVLELSFFWDAVKVKPLIEKCRMTGKIISAQLGQLVKTGVVEKIKGLKKDNLYRISERFFNLWLLMTQGGPEEKHQVKYLTVFLESWYSKDELQKVLSEHISSLKKAKLQPSHVALMSKALAHSRHLSITQRDTLIENTQSYRGIEKEDLVFLPEPSEKIFEKVVEKIKAGKYQQAKLDLEGIEQDCGEKNNLFAIIFLQENDFEQAEFYWLKAIEKGDVKALFNLANLYSETDRPKESEKYYLQAIEKGNIDALFNLAHLYSETDRPKESEKYYLQAIEKGHVGAMVNLAILFYSENYKSQEVLQLMQKAIKLDEKLNYQAIYVVFLLWAGKVKEFDERIQGVFTKALIAEDINILEELVKDLLIHHQYNLAWDWFTSKETGVKLKKMVRPLYFVAAGFISKQETKEELLKAGPEIQESIDQIREYILERQAFYYRKKSK